MTSRRLPLLLPVAALLALAIFGPGCNRKKSPAAQRAEAAAKVEGLGALPADVRVVVGANVPRLRDSSLVKRAFTKMLARDPGVAARLQHLQARCKLDPAKDLDTVLVGLLGSTAERDVVLVAKGRFDEQAIADCVGGALTEAGGTLERKQDAGMTLYVAHNPRASGDVAFAFGAEDTLLVADSEALLRRARDPAQPKLKADAAMMKLIAAADTRAGLWGAGKVAPEVGQGLIAAAGVSAPASAIWGHLDLDAGLQAELAVQLASAADAKLLLKVVQEQLAAYGAVAQVYALGPMVHKIKPEAREAVFVVSLSLDAAEVGKIEELLGARSAGAEKSEPDPTKSEPEKEQEGATP